MESSKYGEIMYMGEVVQNFLRMDGGLAMTMFKNFWRNLQKTEGATAYISVLLTKLSAIEIGDVTSSLPDLLNSKSFIRLTTEEPAPLDPQILNERENILISLFFVLIWFKFDQEMSHFKTALSNWSELSKDKKAFTDELVKLLSSTYLQSNEGIKHLVETCAQTEFPPNFEFTDDKCVANLVAPSFIHAYVQGLLSQGKQIPEIFNSVLLFLKHQQLVTEKMLLTLLHMIKEFIIVSPEIPADILRGAIPLVKTYYLWPRPYGDVAREILQLLTIELKSPGHAMRRLLIEENPALEKDLPKTGLEKAVHILTDSTLNGCRIIYEILKLIEAADVSIPQLQLNLLFNILKTNLPDTDITALNLETLSEENLAKFYEAAVQILNEAVLMNSEEAEPYRTKELKSLLDEITAAPKCEETDLKIKSLQFPSLSFNLSFISTEFTTTESPNSKYPARATTENLAGIFSQYASFASPKRKVPVKVCIIGNDSTIHNVATSFVAWKSSSPKLFAGLDVQFYYVPVENSDLGNFLAKYDSWYAKSIVSLSRAVLRSYPTLRIGRESLEPRSNEDLQQLKKKPSIAEGLLEEVTMISPGFVLKREMENYFRHARVKCELNIYECEAWSANSEFYKPVTIPFCQRFEMGVKSFLRSQKTMDLEQNAKTIKYSPLNLTLKYTQMNILGVEKPGLVAESRPYYSIKITNVPSLGDKGTPPNPSKPWLEMCLDLDKKRKGKVKDLDDTSFYHVTVVELESSDKKTLFHILLDDILYGPFYKLRISPSRSANEDIQTLPIMTFFPLDLPS